MTGDRAPGRRILVVLPSWVGDAVMATPALGLLRASLPGALLGALSRPGIDHVLDGAGFFDEIHHAPASGIMAPKVAAQRVRTRRYDAALLLTNSFSTALSARLAGIPVRMGYDRDGRGVLLTRRLAPQRRRDVAPFSRSATDPGAWAPVPACEYYLRLVRDFVRDAIGREPGAPPPMRLGLTEPDRAGAEAILSRAGLRADGAFVVFNPGGNNPAKRWPAERFSRLASALASGDLTGARTPTLISGSPSEAALVAEIVAGAGARGADGAAPVVDLVAAGVSLGSLKALLARAALLVTNDTGPRHIGAAFGTPVVCLFGPTDHRWTSIAAHCPPRRDGALLPLETVLVADPTLPEEEVANDHPERCAIDRIGFDEVARAIVSALGAGAAPTLGRVTPSAPASSAG